MTVDARHAEYEAHAPDWTLLRDFLRGERAVKAAADAYLPRPQSMSDSEYAAYLTRATLYDATGKTAVAMAGAMFRREPTFELPAALEYLRDDADGRGTPLAQVAKRAAAEVCGLGRVGLLVDFPVLPPLASAAEERAFNAQAKLLQYEAENILNWRYEKVGGAHKLSLLVLREMAEVVDGFETKYVEQRRVLLLVDGRVVVEIWEKRENETTKTMDWQRVESRAPTLPGGAFLADIPFVFIGAADLTAAVDKSPVLDIARVNAAHYRNSADYEDALFMLGQPTPWISGLSPEFIDKYQGQLRIGARSAWLLPQNASAGLLESQSNLGALKDAMEAKERQMAALGARVFEARDGNPEAEGTVRVRQSGEAATLQSIASNVGRALTIAVNWCGLWMQAAGEATITLSGDFFPAGLDPASLDALFRLWQGGAITKQTLFENLLAGEIIADGTRFEDYVEQLEAEAPVLPAFGADEDEEDDEGDAEAEEDEEDEDADEEGA